MGRITVRRPVTRITVGSTAVRRPDTLAVEEPLEIRVGGMPLAVTMRTPGHDVELAAGFLVSDDQVTPSRLTELVLDTLGDPERLAAMSETCRGMYPSDAAEVLAEAVVHVAAHGKV